MRDMMRHKLEVVCGIREILRAGYEMKISWWDRVVLISLLVGCGIVLK